MKISPAIKMYLRDLLNKYNDVVKVLNVFGPNFNILEHREATLVGIKKKKVSDKSDKRVWAEHRDRVPSGKGYTFRLIRRRDRHGGF